MKLIIGIITLSLIYIANEGNYKEDDFDKISTVDSLLNISARKINNKKFQQALYILNEAKALSLKRNNVDKLSDIHFNIGLTQFYLNNFDKSIHSLSLASEGFSKKNEFEKFVSCQRTLGHIFNKKGFHQKAITSYLSALEIAQFLNNKKLIANIQNSLGLLYKESKSYNSAILNFKNALNYQKKSNNYQLQANVLNNLGLIYRDLNEYDKANNFYRKAIRLKKNVGDSASMSTTILNLGELFMDTKQLDSAIIYLNESLNLQENNIDKSLALAAHNLLGEAYRRDKQYILSEQHLKEASVLLEKIESRRHSLDNFKYRKALALDLKNYRKALYWDGKFDSLNSIYFEEERLKVQRIESDYQINQEKEKNKVLEVQRNQQEEIASLRLWIVLILVVILIVIVLLFFQLKNKNKKISLLNEALEKQNEVIRKISINNFHFSKNVFREMKSMLDYQSSRLAKKDRYVFNRVRSSVNTTARLFESMFQKHDDSIQNNKQDIKPFLEMVVQETLHIFGLNDKYVDLNLNINSFFLKSSEMSSLSQIMNELIINSAKYAFNDTNRKGQLDISLEKVKDKIQLDFKDNGPGIINSSKKDSLGMDLIRILTNSLDGTFEILKSNSGTHILIRIPNTHFKPD